MSNLRNRKAALKTSAAPVMRAPIDQLKIIAASYTATSKKKTLDAVALQRLRSLALASVFVIDAMAA